MTKPGRVRLVLILVVLLLAGGGLFLACGGGLDPDACEGGACDAGVSPEGASSTDASTPSTDGSSPASDASEASDAGRDARPLPPCEDGGLPGALDPTFGDGGVVYIDLGAGVVSGADAVVLQPDGRTVLGGAVASSTSKLRFLLVRLTTTGGLDTSFGDGGIVDTPIPAGTGGGVHALTVTGDGTIVAGGLVLLTALSSDFAIARYSPGGVLDRTFGDGGIAFAGIGPPESLRLASIAVLPDGSILAAGDAETLAPHSSDLVIAKLSPNGSLDTTFGASGKARIDIRPVDSGGAMVPQPDGKILVVGSSAPGGGPADPSAVRLNADGSFDPSFGAAGKVVLALPTPSAADTVVLDGAGRIVLGGSTGKSLSGDFAVFRLTSTGALDSTFGSGGVASADFGANDRVMGGGLYIQADGKYLAAGQTYTSSPFTVRDAVARFLPDGAPDLGFGTGGRVVVPDRSDFYVVSSAVAFSGGRATFAGVWRPLWVAPPAPNWMGVSRHCL